MYLLIRDANGQFTACHLLRRRRMRLQADCLQESYPFGYFNPLVTFVIKGRAALHDFSK